jgi:hypothetical protein
MHNACTAQAVPKHTLIWRKFGVLDLFANATNTELTKKSIPPTMLIAMQ